MSVKKWRQQGEEKAEFGQLSGEELFKPITKRLDKAAKEPEPAEEPAGPNYEMDEFDRLNPFYDEFRPDAETPPPSPPPSPSAEDEEGGDDRDFLSAEEEEEAVPLQEATSRKAWEAPAAAPFLTGSSESVDLQTVNRLIKQYDDDPNYSVKSGKSKFRGYLVEDLKRVRDEIRRRRHELPVLGTEKVVQTKNNRKMLQVRCGV